MGRGVEDLLRPTTDGVLVDEGDRDRVEARVEADEPRREVQRLRGGVDLVVGDHETRVRAWSCTIAWRARAQPLPRGAAAADAAADAAAAGAAAGAAAAVARER